MSQKMEISKVFRNIKNRFNIYIYIYIYIYLYDIRTYNLTRMMTPKYIAFQDLSLMYKQQNK